MTDKTTLTIVLFDDFELLDVFGPAEMFGMVRDHFSVQMTAERAGAITSAQGPRVIADVAINELQSLDILMVPGGMGTRTQVNNHDFLSSLRTLSQSAQYVTSVCTGSAVLAKAGILDDRKATSNKQALDWVKTQGPSVDWVASARWVEDGKFWTSSGVSAGMDMAIALIERIAGEEMAGAVAHFAEYRWNSDPNDDPFAKT